MSNDFWESARTYARELQCRLRSSADATHERTSKTLDDLQSTAWDGAAAVKKGAEVARPHIRRLLEFVGIRRD